MRSLRTAVALLLVLSAAIITAAFWNRQESTAQQSTSLTSIPAAEETFPAAMDTLIPQNAATVEHAACAAADLDEATLGFLHAVLTRDQKQLSFFRHALLRSDQDVSVQLARLLTCGIEEVELETMRILIQTGKSKAMAMVLGRMLNIDLTTENAGLYAAVFSECRNSGVSQWLTDCLDESTHESLRHRAAALLCLLQGPETVFAISTQLETADTSAEFHSDGLKLMTARTSPSEVSALIEVFTTAQSLELRESVAFSLAGIGSRQAAEFLVHTAGRDNDDAIIARAALTTISSSQAQQVLLAAALDKDIPEPARAAAVSSLHLQSSDHVATALANSEISPAHEMLNKAIGDALDKHASRDVADGSAGNILGEYHETCF